MWWSGAIVWHLIKEYDSITTTNDAHTIAQVKYVYVVLVCTKANSNTDVAYICMHKMSLFSCSVWQLALSTSKNNLQPLLVCIWVIKSKGVRCDWCHANTCHPITICKRCVILVKNALHLQFSVHQKQIVEKWAWTFYYLDTKCYT